MKSLQAVKKDIFLADEQYWKELLQNIAILQPQNTQKYIRYTLTGSGCRQNACLLSLAIFRTTICAALLALQNQMPISIMITASHNPGKDNGIKVGYANQKVIKKSVYSNIQKTLNSTEVFRQYINSNIHILEQKTKQKSNIVCFVGRDTRTSSPELTKIVLKTFQILQMTLINIQICTTPQLFSFSKYLLEHHISENLTSSKITLLKQKYVKQTLDQFQLIYNIINKQQFSKQKILIDFSNGSGAISIIPYKEILNKYFIIDSIFDKQFDNPNFQCGADYTYRNWSSILQEKYQQYDELIFFDGDSDRIILKVQQSEKCFDGNYFLILYVKTILKILNKLQNEYKLNIQELKVNAIFTYMINQGVKRQLKQFGIEYIASDVGIQNLYSQAIKNSNKIAVFFQPNGHGGVYFDQLTLSKLQQLQNNNPQIVELKILLSFYRILKNNSRGYGLHNMLMFFICKQYLQLKNIEDLFKVARQTSQNIYIKAQFDNLFRNGKQRNNQLIQPASLVHEIDLIRQKNIDYPIIIRKSATEKGLIRVQIQGVDLSKCQTISQQITNIFKSNGYLRLQHKTSH